MPDVLELNAFNEAGSDRLGACSRSSACMPVFSSVLISYDHYDLLVEETRDAIGNRMTVGGRARPRSDYRVTASWRERALARAVM